MIDRFSGKDNPNLLLALCSQFIIRDRSDIAKEISECIELKEYTAGEVILTQYSSSNELHFILAGGVVIRINNRDIAIRGAGTHLGEMALIDPAARRSATVIALEETVTAQISEPQFCPIADRHPIMWRYLAMELGSRLRERSKYVTEPNVTPMLFLGSSKESIPIMKAVVDGLDQSKVKPFPWTADVFWPSHATIEDLERELPHFDFGAFVFGPDDHIISRGLASEGPRDNVLLECGMCLGGIGRNRTYFLKPRGIDIKVPSDLFGLKPIEYEHDSGSGRIEVSVACAEIMKCIDHYGVR